MDAGRPRSTTSRSATRSASCSRGRRATSPSWGSPGSAAADNLAGATLAVFDTPTTQRVLDKVGRFDSVDVVGDGSLVAPRPAEPGPGRPPRGLRGPHRHPGGRRAVGSDQGRPRLLQHLPAGVRRDLAVRGRVHDPEHVLHPRRPAHPGTGAAAGPGGQPGPDPGLRRGRGGPGGAGGVGRGRRPGHPRGHGPQGPPGRVRDRPPRRRARRQAPHGRDLAGRRASWSRWWRPPSPPCGRRSSRPWPPWAGPAPRAAGRWRRRTIAGSLVLAAASPPWGRGCSATPGSAWSAWARRSPSSGWPLLPLDRGADGVGAGPAPPPHLLGARHLGHPGPPERACGTPAAPRRRPPPSTIGLGTGRLRGRAGRLDRGVGGRHHRQGPGRRLHRQHRRQFTPTISTEVAQRLVPAAGAGRGHRPPDRRVQGRRLDHVALRRRPGDAAAAAEHRDGDG